MKKNLKSIGALLAIGLLTVSTRAAVILQEDFAYPDGALTSVSGGNWTAFSGAGTYAIQDVGGIISFTNVPSGTSGEDLDRNFSAPVTSGTLYLRALVNMTTVPALPKTNGDYFLAFYSTNGSGGGYASRIFCVAQSDGGWSLGMTNAGGSAPSHWGTDLTAGTTYQVFLRYDLATRTAAFGVFDTLTTPTESQLTVTSPASSATAPITSIAIRQGSAAQFAGTIDSITVGTSFADVGGAPSAPIILVQPQDATNFVGSTVSFTNVSTGDLPLSYYWFYNTNTPLSDSATIMGSATNVLVLSSLVLTQSGTYSCVISNDVGTNVTRYAALTVSPQPIPPIIDSNIQPVGSTNTVGDNVTFTVVAHGLPTPAFQWKVVNGSVTNPVAGSNVTGTNTGTLTITGVKTNQSGTYFVTLTNIAGYLTTNSALAVLQVNPPPMVNISTLRAMQDPTTWAPTDTASLFIVQGIVTTWTNLTTSGNSEFYIQDSSGGVAVFWSGAAASTNLPPAGALVQVTAPLASFDGLLELEPVFTNSLQGVVVLSTGNPLPTPQPLPFDPNIQNNTPAMEQLEGSYFVASNVMLNLSTPTFVANANDPTTNLAYHVLADTSAAYNITFTNDVGQTFILFVNSHTDLPGQTKPAGPVTVYGVLGQFVSTSPYIGGYEFTPSRYADIISYVHATNVLSNVKHWGDALTNSFTESALRPGETLTMYVSIGDPAGGTVTLTPITGGLPASASWSNVTSGQTAAAIFHFSPVAGDAGANYVVALAESSTSGFMSTNYWNVYVPTPDEQKMAITEFLANPTTNASAPNFNPLHRATDTIGILTNDQYIEVANSSSGTTLDYGWDLDNGNPGVTKLFDSNAGSGTTVSPSSAVVIYGGDTGESPSLPVTAATSGGLLLPTSGTGVIILRNPSGYIIDRVVYSASDLSTNSSLTRFPTINSPFVPQIYVGTNAATAGLQYDGGSWSAPAQIPTGVNNVVINVVNKQAVLQFTAVPNQASTLWSANDLTNPFKVIFGQPFATSAGVFSVTNLPPLQFYYITTQTNRP